MKSRPARKQPRDAASAPSPEVPAPGGPDELPGHQLLKIVVLVLFAMVALRHAWLGDDAFITFRCVANFHAGHGLVWNVDERVQAFTHPLWALLLCAATAITGEFYYTVLVLQVALSACAAWLLLGRARTRSGLALVAIALLGTKGWLEYSTSGLENPLTHLLVMLFAREALRDEPRAPWLGLWCGLIALNRLDAVLLWAPFALMYALRRGARPTAKFLATALPPLLAWEAFSFVYYGFLLPNTAYAKLAHGIPADELLAQGVRYFSNVLIRDPGVPCAIAVGLALAAARARRDPAGAGLALGVVAYLTYILRIGGDFMTGRLFTAPFALAMVLFVRALPVGLDGALAVALLALSQLAPAPLFLHMADYTSGVQDNKGISDEAKFYGIDTGLVIANRIFGRSGVLPGNNWALEGRRAETAGVPWSTGACGFSGFNAGTLHIVDVFGLCDPLLARLPAIYNPTWRIGHFERTIPEGYMQTLQTGADHFRDRNLARYYGMLRRVITGPVFDLGRLQLALEMNLGTYDHLIDRERYRYPDLIHVAAARLSTPRREGASWDEPGHLIMKSSGARVMLPELSHAAEIEVSLDNNDRYRLTFIKEGEEVGRMDLGPRIAPGGLRVYREPIPQSAQDSGFDTIRVLPLGYDGCYSMGHLLLR